MKKIIFGTLLILGMAFILPSCNKSSSEKKGDVMFWTRENTQIITVTFRNSNRTISTRYTSSTPDCGYSGCATYNDVPTGTYSYHAENLYYYWDGSVTVRKDECTKMQLSIYKAVKKSEPSGDNASLECFEEEDFYEE